MNGITLPLLIVVLVVAWLTTGSMALRSVSRIWLRHWAERRMRGAGTALTYLDRPQRLLVASNAGVAIAVVAGGGLLSAYLALDRTRFAVAVFLFAMVLLLLGQIVPRAIGRRWAPSLIPLTMPVLRLAEIVAQPLLDLGGVIARWADPRDAAREPRDPIHDLLREGALEGVGEQGEIAIITGVVEFGEKVARDVMTPAAEVFSLSADLPPDAIAQQIATAGYSRVPLYRGTPGDVVGMVHVLDVLKGAGEREPALRPVAMTTPDVACTDLLFRMLRARRHLAVVRDAAGAMVGIVTLEDLIEELVGDIRDEHDEPPPPTTPAS